MKIGDTIDGHTVTEVRKNGSIVAKPKVAEPVVALARKLYWQYQHGIRPGREEIWQRQTSSWQANFIAQARYVLENFVPRGEVQQRISPENLDTLAEGQHDMATMGAYRCLPSVAVPYEKHAEEDKQAWRNDVLAMLNAKVAEPHPVGEHAELVGRGHKIGYADAKGKYEGAARVAEPDVDFIVSGKDGERLTAVSEKGRTHWVGVPMAWKKFACDQRRIKLAFMYDTPCTILLDKNWRTK